MARPIVSEKPSNQSASITINGIFKVGEILTASVTDENGVPDAVAYQWYANGVPISGATNQIYTLKADDAGKVIAGKAVFTDNAGYDESATSAASVPVKPIVPSPPAGAVVSLSGWYLDSHSIAGKLVTLNALKPTNGGGLKSTIINTPNVDEISNYLLSVDGSDALNKAVADLIGADTAWQLDAINKRVVYTT